MFRRCQSKTLLAISVALLSGAFASLLPAADPVNTSMSKSLLHWEKLPPLPDHEGFATPFAGVSGEALIVAGGANFPDKRPWEGGTKIWYDHVFVLEKPNGTWQSGFKLPKPNAYGVSLTTAEGLICLGGGDAKQNFNDVFLLKWADHKISATPLPGLPKPCAFMCGALVGHTIYLAGGIETPNATTALKTFWSLNLTDQSPHWQELEPWPGPERILATAGAHDGSFFLFSGAQLKPGPDGKPARTWLRDAYRYTSGKGWQQLNDLPRVAVAAPSPAPVVNGKLLIIGGDDGAQVNTPPTAHTGFPRELLAFNPLANTWEHLGDVPFSLVTTPCVNWQGRIIIPGGEAKPGIRSPAVWSAQPIP